jgi:uncharacterized protein YaaW (UPF0174 family)
MKLIEILKKANKEELNGMAKILDMDKKNHYSPAEIKEKLMLKDSLASILFTKESGRYHHMVYKTAKKLNVNNPKLYSTEELEIKISQKIFKKLWNNMSAAQQEKFESKMKEVAKEHGNEKALFANAGVFGVLTAAQLSGFGVYMLATSSLGAITGAMGITLPFAAYTTVTSALGVIVGPVGWIGAGLLALFTLGGREYKKLIPAIIYVSMLRNKEYKN